MAFFRYQSLEEGGRRKAATVAVLVSLAVLLLSLAVGATVWSVKHGGSTPLDADPLVLNANPSSPPNTCMKFHHDDGVVTAVCKSDPVLLRPGENQHTDFELPNPYPLSGYVGLYTFSSQIVDRHDRAVPLDDVYAHHVQGPVALFGSEGAEMRFSFKAEPLPQPYMHVIDAQALAGSPEALTTQVHLISLDGVEEKDVKRCIECWCQPDQPGLNDTVFCCTDCPASRDGPRRTFFVKFVVTYRVLHGVDQGLVVPTHTVLMDPSGNSSNGGAYNVFPARGPGEIHNFTRRVPIDWFCPQDSEWGLIRCSAHQHIGGQGMRIYDDESGELICSSFPRYGTKKGESGNEAGYLVEMSTDTLAKPYFFKPGQIVRFESLYDWSQPYGGVMSQMRFIQFGMNLTNCEWLEYATMLSIPHNVTV